MTKRVHFILSGVSLRWQVAASGAERSAVEFMGRKRLAGLDLCMPFGSPAYDLSIVTAVTPVRTLSIPVPDFESLCTRHRDFSTFMFCHLNRELFIKSSRLIFHSRFDSDKLLAREILGAYSLFLDAGYKSIRGVPMNVWVSLLGFARQHLRRIFHVLEKEAGIRVTRGGIDILSPALLVARAVRGDHSPVGRGRSGRIRPYVEAIPAWPGLAKDPYRPVTKTFIPRT